jgi:hypothetical protein
MVGKLDRSFSCPAAHTTNKKVRKGVIIEYRKGWSSPVQGYCHNPLRCVAGVLYITKLATPQSQKPRSPPPPNYNLMYPKDAPVRPGKISSVHKMLLTCPWAECTVLKVPVNIYLYFHLLICVCLKTIQVYIYGDENV